ncbi:hypothetical protein C4565_09380 [Candidatus Parcubacteria bacterium]|jgi:hypothetical protein|nr:MAG: hypothetical protein C4565_09380 [Candidatus Parcubacteria bacterium]
MNLVTFADRFLGDEPSVDLTQTGPASKAITGLTSSIEQAASLIATLFWEAFVVSAAFDFTLKRAGFPVKYALLSKQLIVYHGPPIRPRFDLLILTPHYIREEPLTIPDVDTSPDVLRRGIEQILESAVVERSSLDWWKKIWRYAVDAVIEASQAQRFGMLITQQPTIDPDSSGGFTKPILPLNPLEGEENEYNQIPSIPLSCGLLTALCPSPSWKVGWYLSVLGAGFNPDETVSTVGVVAEDESGRTGVTTALHALKPRRSYQYSSNGFGLIEESTQSHFDSETVLVNGKEGRLAAINDVQDSCFILVELNQHIETHKVKGVLADHGPGMGEVATFEGVASGKVQTRIVGCDLGIPYWIDPNKQLAVYTDAVTKRGDSGAALLNSINLVVGFAHQRIGGQLEYSDWIWANSVFKAHGLRID